MAVTLNAKGTSVPYFKLGKSGITLFQGSSDPHATLGYSVSDNDIWFDTTTQTVKYRSSSSFTVGTAANVSGNTYYVAKVTVQVRTEFVGADELVISDGSNTLVGANDVDLSEGGIYMIDLGYENATSGGATISASIQNGGSSASPSTGNVIVTAEYKQV